MSIKEQISTGAAQTWTAPQTFSAALDVNDVNISSFVGGAWIDMPVSGPSGIGTGGPGGVAWLAYCASPAQWFSDSLAQDLVMRFNPGKHIRIGSNPAQSLMQIGDVCLSILKPVINYESLVNTTVSGNIVVTAADMLRAFFVDSAIQSAAYTITTDSAINILRALPPAIIGSSFKWRVINNDQSATGYPATTVGGAGVTIATSPLADSPIPKGGFMDYLMVFTAVGASPAITLYPIGGNSAALL